MPVAIGIAASLALLIGFAMTRALRAARMPAAVGVQGMVGNEAVVRQDGMVQLNGELWRARSSEGAALIPGEHVRVEEVEDDLRLVVGSMSTPTWEEPH
jgi:membrane protein implicated in regulation of membrane protease activity